jgi:hypothetical protein
MKPPQRRERRRPPEGKRWHIEARKLRKCEENYEL